MTTQPVLDAKEALLKDWRWKHFFRIREARLPPQTPADRVMRAFETPITAMAIAEGLHTCEISDETAVVLLRMAENDFDSLGVRNAEGATIGYVNREEIGAGQAGDYLRAFTSSDLISDSTPLYEVLAVLRNQPRAFLIGGPSVFAVVTRADLQKEPVRVYAFALVTMLEMQLSRVLRNAYPGDEWQKYLSTGRVGRAIELHRARKARNEQLSPFDCLQLCDKRDLVSRHPLTRETLGFRTKGECVSALKRVEALRDRVAHAQDVSSDSDWPETIHVFEAIDLMLQRLA